MIYLDISKLFEIMAGKTEQEFCHQVRVSQQLCYRLFQRGGPVLRRTLTKIAGALWVPPIYLVDLQRTPKQNVQQLTSERRPLKSL